MTNHAPILAAHAAFEATHPDHAEMAASYEQARALNYQRANGTLDGYIPSRLPVCPGMLRLLDDTGSVQVVECDVCGFSVGVCRERPAGSSQDFESSPSPF